MPGIYIHIPFCKSKCSYCDFCSYPDKLSYQESYMACLYREIRSRGEELKDYLFDTVYFGGGTPSIIDEKYILGAMNAVKKYMRITPDAEVTIEINPGTVTKQKIETYKKCGINRFSVGLQTGVESQLRDIGRIHTALDYVHTTKFLDGENFSTDVMIGLRGQEESDVTGTIELAAKCGSKHISMYALTPEDGTPIYTQYLNGELPDEDEVASLYEAGLKKLKELGFERYEVSNFAHIGYESKHNMNYWKRGEYVGLGVAASSFIGGKRFTNTYDLDEYMKCIISSRYAVVDSEEIDDETAAFETIMLALRTSRGLNVKEYSQKYGDFNKKFEKQLYKLEDYLERKGDYLKIKDEYLYIQNTIVIEFLNEQK